MKKTLLLAIATLFTTSAMAHEASKKEEVPAAEVVLETSEEADASAAQ